MRIRNAAALAGLLITGACWAAGARSGPERPSATPDRSAADGAVTKVASPPTDGPRLKQRKALRNPTDQIRRTDDKTGRLVVKFRDDVKARPGHDGATLSRSGKDLTALERLLEGTGLRFEPAFHFSDEVLQELQDRAAARTQTEQLDLGGMMYLTGEYGVPEHIARAVNELQDIVEFVEYEPQYMPALSPRGATGACCFDSGGGVQCIDDVTQVFCVTSLENGFYQGDGSTCAGNCGACCLDDGQTCFLALETFCDGESGDWQGNFTDCGEENPDGFFIGCLGEPTGACCLPDETCVDDLIQTTCERVGGQYEGVYQGDDTTCPPGGCVVGACCFFGVDLCNELNETDCLAMGGAYIGPGTECMDDNGNGIADDCDINFQCGEFFAGDCYSVKFNPYCNAAACCDVVCALDPFCCDQGNWPARGGDGVWDVECVEKAREICGDPFFETPEFLGNCAVSVQDCFEAGTGVGCGQVGCCVSVCVLDPLCCDVEWSADCVLIAEALCTAVDPEGATPNLAGAQAYLYSAPFGLYGGVQVIPPYLSTGLIYGTDNLPLAGYQGGGYDLQGMWEVGDILLNDAGLGNANLTRGHTMKVGVIDANFWVSTAVGPDAPYGHEDIDGKVIPEPGQTPIIIPSLANLRGDHGTACLGIIGAIDHDATGAPTPPGSGLEPDLARADEVGCIGIAPDATLYAFPTFTAEQPGGRTLEAIASALTIFEPGDVLCLPFTPDSVRTLASDFNTWTLLRLAADLGVTCCIAAGNGSSNCDNNPQAGGDSDAIIVGAVFPGGRNSFQEYARYFDREDGGSSNFCRGCTDTSRLHIAGWGDSIVTIGPSLRGPADVDLRHTIFGDDDFSRAYRNDFGDTSGATAMVAGLVTCLQGLAKQTYGITLTPAQIRDRVITTGALQNGVLVPPGNNVNPAAGDWTFGNPPNRVGTGNPNTAVFTNALSAAEHTINNETGGFFDGNSLLAGLFILRGDLTYGNVNSIKSADGNFLVVRSLYTRRSYTPSTGTVGDSVRYFGTGHTVDIMAVQRLNVTATSVNTLSINTVFDAPIPPSILVVEAFDYVANRWNFVAVESLPENGGPQDFTHEAVNAPRFVGNPLRGSEVLVRVYVIGLGGTASLGGLGGGGSTGAWDLRVDLIRVGIDNNFGGTTPVNTGGGAGPVGGPAGPF